MSRFRPAGFRNGRTAWRRASRPDSGRPGTVRWHRATDLPLPPTVKRRSARRPPPMARPRSEVQRGFREARRRHASTHREMRCSAAVQAARYRAAFIRRSTAGEMLNELRLAPDMLTLAAIGAAM